MKQSKFAKFCLDLLLHKHTSTTVNHVIFGVTLFSVISVKEMFT